MRKKYDEIRELRECRTRSAINIQSCEPGGDGMIPETKHVDGCSPSRRLIVRWKNRIPQYSCTQYKPGTPTPYYSCGAVGLWINRRREAAGEKAPPPLPGAGEGPSRRPSRRLHIAFYSVTMLSFTFFSRHTFNVRRRYFSKKILLANKSCHGS